MEISSIIVSDDGDATSEMFLTAYQLWSTYDTLCHREFKVRQNKRYGMSQNLVRLPNFVKSA
jgi:hypothetical protein